MARIGVGILTYERFERFKDCFENLLKNSHDVEEILIVDDGSTKDKVLYENFFNNLLLPKFKIIINETNIGVSASKNRILEYFFNKDYDYIFIIENDINILSPDVFNKYIETSKLVGYDYFTFGVAHYQYSTRKNEMIINNVGVNVYPDLKSGFQLFTKKLISTIGFFDESFKNAYYDADYYYRAAKAELTSPFWMFIDVYDSSDYLEEQSGSILDSSLRTGVSFIIESGESAKIFYNKHGVSLHDIPHL